MPWDYTQSQTRWSCLPHGLQEREVKAIIKTSKWNGQGCTLILFYKSALYLRGPVHIWCGSLLQHKEEESRHSKKINNSLINFKNHITTNACWLDMTCYIFWMSEFMSDVKVFFLPSHKYWCPLHIWEETQQYPHSLQSWPVWGHSLAPLQ